MHAVVIRLSCSCYIVDDHSQPLRGGSKPDLCFGCLVQPLTPSHLRLPSIQLFFSLHKNKASGADNAGQAHTGAAAAAAAAGADSEANKGYANPYYAGGGGGDGGGGVRGSGGGGGGEGMAAPGAGGYGGSGGAGGAGGAGVAAYGAAAAAAAAAGGAYGAGAGGPYGAAAGGAYGAAAGGRMGRQQGGRMGRQQGGRMGRQQGGRMGRQQGGRMGRQQGGRMGRQQGGRMGRQQGSGGDGVWLTLATSFPFTHVPPPHLDTSSCIPGGMYQQQPHQHANVAPQQQQQQQQQQPAAFQSPPSVCQQFALADLARATRLSTRGECTAPSNTAPSGTCMHPQHCSSGSHLTKTFQREVAAMVTKHHPNLVRLLGYCIDMHPPAPHSTQGDLSMEQIVVYEFMGRGDLDRWVGEGAAQPLPVAQRVARLSLPSPGGIDMHPAAPHSTQGDLDSNPPTSILLESKIEVADFGLLPHVPCPPTSHA
ncbi:unnamed protein product [Closterium sp. Naga37s-1]|nr:unnamed protein product [Closterium sp. Naga37s-1]